MKTYDVTFISKGKEKTKRFAGSNMSGVIKSFPFWEGNAEIISVQLIGNFNPKPGFKIKV